MGRGFIPLAAERYDFAVRRRHLDMPGAQILCEALTRASFRRELENVGGYETSATGRRMM
jgi:molybdate-binding protein